MRSRDHQDNVDVYLDERLKPIGVLRFTSTGGRLFASFEYTPDYLQDPRAFAIDIALPLAPGVLHKGRPATAEESVFHGCFADAEPDGWGKRYILRSARKLGAGLPPGGLSALDSLLAVSDYSRVGALRFKHQPDGEYLATGRGHHTPPLIALPQLSNAVSRVEAGVATARDIQYLAGNATSLDGMRPKVSVIDHDGSLALAKFPSQQDQRDVVRCEVLALQLAAQAGIRAATARLEVIEQTPVALIRRFDRRGNHRLPYLSAASLLEANPRHDNAYTEIVDGIRVHGSEAAADTLELWRRMAFNVLINNVDDHLKNHGFLHEQSGQWTLAPAFDVNPFPDKPRVLKTWLTEEVGPHASVDGLMSSIDYFRIPLAAARRMLGHVAHAVTAWEAVADSLQLGRKDREQLRDLFESDGILAEARRESGRSHVGRYRATDSPGT